MTIDGLEVSEWWKSKKNQVPVDMHNRWWEVWNSESADVKADYYAKSKAQKAAEQVRKKLLIVIPFYLLLTVGYMAEEDQRGKSSASGRNQYRPYLRKYESVLRCEITS